MAGAATAVSGGVKAGAERELQPGTTKTKTKTNTDTNTETNTKTNTETNKTTNAQSQPVSKQKQSVKAIYPLIQKKELQTGHEYCAVARSCYPTNQLI